MKLVRKRQSSKEVSHPRSQSTRTREPSWLRDLRSWNHVRDQVCDPLRDPMRDPVYRRMRRELIQQIAPRDPIEWILADEYVLSQYQVMRFGRWQIALLQFNECEGVKRVVKERLRARNSTQSEDELDYRAARLAPSWRPAINRDAIEAETCLSRRGDMDSVHRRQLSAQHRRDTALRQIHQWRSRKEEQLAQTSRVLTAALRNGGSSAPEVNGGSSRPEVNGVPTEDLPSTPLRNDH
jgi:hypothetical protein